MKKLMIMTAIIGATVAVQAAATYEYSYFAGFRRYSEKDPASTDFWADDEHQTWYSVYGMTQDTARELLGTDEAVTYLDVANWLGKSFSANSAEVVDQSQPFTIYQQLSAGFYQFDSEDNIENCFEDYADDFIGVIFFDNGTDKAYNVISADTRFGKRDKFYFLEENLGNSKTSGWVLITPEPTSGLLMLLGMAGLALKRRRA